MEGLNNNIFDSAPNDIVIPGLALDFKEVSIGEEDLSNKLKGLEELMSDSESIEGAISGDVVKSVLLPEDTGIILPNYVIDLTKIEEIEPIQVMALDSLLNEDGDVGIYLYIKGGIEKIGMSYGHIIDRIIVPAIGSIFNGGAPVYKDYQPGKAAVVADTNDIGSLRLSI